ncbi:Tfp pilus assembly protein PilN [Paraburkholderia sp. UCT70]|uniref:PilN domain-containing protein n=1 Tax=Paraburkholderia sp. UCT70 TaxID=2991068 RepID=UPI003D21AF08
MTPRLHIDFGRHRALTAPAGVVLLCAASLLLLMSGARLWHAYDENDRVQAEQDVQRHRLLARSHPAAVKQTPAAKLAQSQSLAVLRELTVPWQDLLSIVEDYPKHDVALIGIDQSPAQSQIRITAEAKDFDAMIAYLRYLQASVLLREAVLNNHVVETNEPGTPVRFQITAVWRKS